MITKLVLENWRSHEKTEFEFAKGTNVLVGAMGSGKTSAMDAICFALFGTFPLLQSKKVKLDDMIMNKPKQKSHAKVTLEMTLNGDNYRIKRTIPLGKPSTGELWKNEALVEGPQNTRTTEKICDLLKIDYDLFSRAVYAEQNNIEYFLEIPKFQRKQKIDELLKISKFENARKNLATLIGRISDRVEDLSKLAESEAAVKEIPEVEKELAQKLSKQSEIREKLKSAENRRQNAQTNYAKISSKKARYDELDSLAKKNEGIASSLAKRIAEYGEVHEEEESVRKKLAELEKTIEETRKKQAEKEALEKAREKALGAIEENESRVKEYREKLSNIFVPENIEKLREETEKHLDSITREHESLKAKYALIEEQKKELDGHVDLSGLEKCPTCETKLTPESKKHVMEERKKKRNALEEEQEKIKCVGKELEAERKKKRELLEKIRESISKLEEKKWLEEALRKTELQLIESREALKSAEKKLESLEIDRTPEKLIEETHKYEKIIEYYNYKKQLLEAEKYLQKAKNEMLSLGYNAAEEKKLYEELGKAETACALLRQEYESTVEIIEEKKKRLNELLDIRKEVEKTKRESEYLKKTKENFEVLENVLRNAQGKLRQEFIDTTNAALTDVWQRIYPYGDYEDLKMNVDEAGDYTLQLKTRSGKYVNVEGITSGGERSIAALALRIAFSLVLTQNLSWLVLDEPTHNLDKTAVSELSETLKTHLPSIVDQIFIITHEPLLEDAASAYLYRLERRKEMDEPTKVVVEKKF
ncbi:MAG: SMC family ATPase [archaeon]